MAVIMDIGSRIVRNRITWIISFVLFLVGEKWEFDCFSLIRHNKEPVIGWAPGRHDRIPWSWPGPADPQSSSITNNLSMVTGFTSESFDLLPYRVSAVLWPCTLPLVIGLCTTHFLNNFIYSFSKMYNILISRIIQELAIIASFPAAPEGI